MIALTAALALAAGCALAGPQRPVEAPGSSRPETTRPAVAGRHGLVTSGHPIASSAGLQVLLKGGNAFDAAVAVGAMAALGEPEMNGIGGNGFMTVFHRATGTVWSLAMAGAAPQRVVPAEMTPATLNEGMQAGIVPGNLGGYLVALERFGTMRLAEVLAPAIEYAEAGYPIDPRLAQAIAQERTSLAKYPTTAKIFLPAGQPLAADELLRNPDYAATLRKLVEAEAQAQARGATRSEAIMAAFDRFYKGDIAQEMERFFEANGGLLTAADLAAYSPQWAEPLVTSYRGYDVYSNPATSRGGFEVLMGANLLAAVDLKAAGPGSPATLHAIIEAIKISKADIYRYVADPQFTQVPVAGLLAPEFAAVRRELFDPTRAIAYPPPGAPAGAPTTRPRADGPTFADDVDAALHTTSFSIVDQFGNAVGCTPTLGSLFGSKVVVGNTGLLLNNGMRLGSTSPYPTDANYVGPGKTPLLNNSPVVVLRDGQLAFVFGTPGGETIGQIELQVLLNLVDFEMPVQQAIEAPRLVLKARPNFYKPGAAISVNIEGRVPAATIDALAEMGHHVEVLPGWGSLGHVQAIRVDPKTGAMTAGADPRRTGYAMGY
ncbi:gamma-glutamyltransferase [Nannocystis pusilla]|uniref:gamma-glutamyltransferase n=1 Tax=Nannocystis pusilla TaxID=889268 RepID=UPI003B79F656